MPDRFIQKRAFYSNEESSDRLQIKHLMTLVERHPYLNDIITAFKTDELAEEFILIDRIDLVFAKLKRLNKDFERFNISARISDISIRESKSPLENLANPLPLIFNFSVYNSNGQSAEDMDAYAIYDAKNTFFDNYEMSKYANHLYKNGLGELAKYNLEYFKQQAASQPELNAPSSYRMVLNEGDVFLRGITSVGRYFEYGVDFAFVVTMLSLHNDMKKNAGNGYTITSTGLSESKLELIIADNRIKNAGAFGNVSSALVVTTNDLGQGSLNFTKIIRVGDRINEGMYLYPKSENARENKLLVSHSTKQDRVFEKLAALSGMLNNTDDFITDLNDVKSIKKPEELRQRIYNRLNNPRNALYNIQSLKDIFKNHINDELNDLVKLLKMCSKAEELDIDYDLKEKLRYLISDIILNRKSDQ